MANDHYVPQSLTRPWEYGERKLRCFDFVTREFADHPARYLLSKKGLNSPAAEAWLNQTVEDPVGKYLARVRARGTMKPNERERRALVLLFALNAVRIQEARKNEDMPIGVEYLATHPALVEALVRKFTADFKMFARRLPPEHELFFTEVATFAIPYAGKPVLAIPLDIDCAFCAYEGPLAAERVSRDLPDLQVEVASLGIGRDVHRVVLPPKWRDTSFRDEADTRQRLLDLREANRAILDLWGRASELAGLERCAAD